MVGSDFDPSKLSSFRKSFELDDKDIELIQTSGEDKIKDAAYHFVRTRIAPQNPKNDGKQTPWEGHPVFKAQHATGTCCRKCLKRIHKIPTGRELDEEEIDYVVGVIMDWIDDQVEKSDKKQARLDEF